MNICTIENAKEIVQNALNLLGEHGKITKLTSHNPFGLWVVEVDNEYFGIYDISRNTFVD